MAETCASQLITRKGNGRDKAAPMLLALVFAGKVSFGVKNGK